MKVNWYSTVRRSWNWKVLQSYPMEARYFLKENRFVGISAPLFLPFGCGFFPLTTL